MGVFAVLSSVQWLLIVIVALALNGANVVGYFKCSNGALFCNWRAVHIHRTFASSQRVTMSPVQRARIVVQRRRTSFAVLSPRVRCRPSLATPTCLGLWRVETRSNSSQPHKCSVRIVSNAMQEVGSRLPAAAAVNREQNEVILASGLFVEHTTQGTSIRFLRALSSRRLGLPSQCTLLVWLLRCMHWWESSCEWHTRSAVAAPRE